MRFNRLLERALTSASRSFSTLSLKELEAKLKQVNKDIERKNYRAVFEAPEDADKKAIGVAYRSSIQKFHPDKFLHDKSSALIATQITERINAAYEQQKPKTHQELQTNGKSLYETMEELNQKLMAEQKIYEKIKNDLRMEREIKYSDLIKKIQRNDPRITNLDQEFEKIYSDKNLLGKDFFLPEKTEILAQALEKNTFVKKLNLSRFSIGDKGVRALAKMMKLNNSLEELEIDSLWDKLNDESISSLADALKVNTSVKTFNFVYPRENPNLIIDSLKQNQTVRKAVIGVDSRMDYRKEAPETLANLAELIAQNTALEELDLIRFNIRTDPDSTNISDAWQKNKNLKRFGLHGSTSRSKEELDALITSLGNSTSLTHLTIAGHKHDRIGEDRKILTIEFGDEEAFTIAKLIKANNSLESIDIERCCEITSIGLQAIAEALEGNNNIKEMKVKANNPKYGVRDDTLVPKSALELEKRIADLVERNCNLAKDNISQPCPSPSSADISQAGFQDRGR